MNRTNKNPDISCYLVRFFLLLFAISPVVYAIDWLYYTIAGLAISSFILSIVYGAKGVRKSKRSCLNFLIGSREGHIYDLMIGFVGIVVNYATGNEHMIFLWLFLLSFAVVELIYPTRLKKSKEVS